MKDKNTFGEELDAVVDVCAEVLFYFVNYMLGLMLLMGLGYFKHLIDYVFSWLILLLMNQVGLEH